MKFDCLISRLGVLSSQKQILKLKIVSSSLPHNVMPEISIIVPVYNAEKYIARCLDALIQQTFQDIEVICIDDGSPDNCPQILDDYAKKDSRICVIHQQNAGQGAARNRGLQEVSGNYIMFCDDDDWYSSNMCQKMLDTIKETKTDMVVCNPFIEQTDKTLERIGNNSIGTIPGGYYKGIDKYFLTTAGLAWNKIFKTEIVNRYHATFGLKFGEDLCFVREYLFSGVKTFYDLNQNLYHYVMHTASATGKFVSLVHLDHISGYRKTYDFLQNNGLWNQHEKLFKYAYLSHLRKTWLTVNNANQQEFFDRIREFINYAEIDNWGDSYSNKMIDSIRQGKDDKAYKQMFWWLYVRPRMAIEFTQLVLFRLFFSSIQYRKFAQ